MVRFFDDVRHGLRNVPAPVILALAGTFLLAASVIVWWDTLLAFVLALIGLVYAVWVVRALERDRLRKLGAAYVQGWREGLEDSLRYRNTEAGVKFAEILEGNRRFMRQVRADRHPKDQV